MNRQNIEILTKNPASIVEARRIDCWHTILVCWSLLVLCIISAGKAHGAIAYVQQTGTATKNLAFPYTSTALSVSNAPAVGNTIIVSVGVNVSSSSGGPTCSDDQGNTYSMDASLKTFPSGPYRQVFICSTQIAAGKVPSTITVTHDNANESAMDVHEFSGIEAAPRVDKFSTNSGNSTTPTSNSTGASSESDVLVFGAVEVNGPSSDSFTADSNFSGGPFRISINNVTINTQYWITSGPAGTYAYAPTLGTSRAWTGAVATYKAVPSTTFTVTKTADTRDGTCDADCSLREAIDAANGSTGDDIITLPAGTYTLTLTGAFEHNNVVNDLDITESVTINGAGSSSTFIDGNAGTLSDRILHTTSTAANVTINDVTFQNADAGSRNGAGIFHEGTNLTLNRVIVKDMTTTMNGGGIRADGDLFLNDVEFSNNSAGSSGGGIYTTGASGATVTWNGGTASGNSATSDGGAIRSGGTLIATNVTLSGNSANGSGAAIVSNGTTTMTNVTIYGSTGSAGEAYRRNSGTSTIKNTIVSSAALAKNCNVTLTSAGGNLETVRNDCGFSAGTDQNSISLVNLNINATLADNGGYTKTHALNAGSYAIDAAVNANCPADDQRDIARGVDGDASPNSPQSGDCDIGAYEYEPAAGYNVSGKVFEDAKFAGTAADYVDETDDKALANVDVELYNNSDVYQASTTTDANGDFSFTGLANGTYKVRVRAATIADSDTTPKGGLNGTVPATWPYPLPEMTWGNGSAMYGGQSATADDTDTGDNAGPGDNWVSVSVSDANVSNVNFGFAYNLIVNVEDDGNADSALSDQGSLRQFIKNANAIASAGGTTANYSQFRMQVATNQVNGADNWWRISLNTLCLPKLTDDGTTLDASRQRLNSASDDNSRGPEIEIKGNKATIASCSGFTIENAVNGTVNEFALNDFSLHGVSIGGIGTTGADIFGSYLGTDAVGENAVPNDWEGIYVYSLGGYPSDVDIGGSNAGEGNLISGNIKNGINLGGGSNIRIYGNKIGTNRQVSAKLANLLSGVKTGSANPLYIGGSAAGQENIISGNNVNGIQIDSGASDVHVKGNVIGTGTVGNENLGNAARGVRVFFANSSNQVYIGGVGSNEGNTIAYNATEGVGISGTPTNVEVRGNTIRNNSSYGINSATDDVDITNNIIRDNASADGLYIAAGGTNNLIYHNTIHNNGGDGIEILATGAMIKNNIITGNTAYGINVNGGAITDAYNLITDNSTSPANTSGQSNIALSSTTLNADPVYTNAGSSDYTLQNTSPAINRGCDLGAAGDDTGCDDANDGAQPDLTEAANPNFYGYAPDLGAFENTLATTCVVTTTADNATPPYGSLRECINYANSNPGTTIKFALGVGDSGYQTAGAENWWRISPTNIYSITANGTIIDATTQTSLGDSNTLGPEIEIDGSGAGAVDGFDISSANNEIRGLIINGYTTNDKAGIDMAGAGATGNTIAGNYLGTNYAGTSADANDSGVAVKNGANGNTIGGIVVADRNIISGNTARGVWVTGSGSDSNVIKGNYIGTDASGTASVPNGSIGLYLSTGAQSNIVGGTTAAERNVISGNGARGVRISSAGTDLNVVQGNYIGTDKDGTAPLANSSTGVYILSGAQSNIIGGTAAGEGNTIAYNGADGVYIKDATTDANEISGNSIFENTGLGIDLDGAGANNDKAAPTISTLAQNASDFDVSVTITSGDTVEFFRVNNTAGPAVTADGSGAGEGYLFLGSCIDGGACTDAPGSDYLVSTSDDDATAGVVQVTLRSTGVSSGDEISTTAFDVTNGTSEFSSNHTISFVTTIGDGIAPIDKSVAPSSANNAVSAFTLSVDNGTDTLTDLTVTFTGTSASDVAASGVKIYKDVNGDSEWDAGDTLITNGTASFSGNTASFTSLSEGITTTAASYIITYDLAAGAAEGNTLRGEITAATVSTNNPPTESDTLDATLTVAANAVTEFVSTINTPGEDYNTITLWEDAMDNAVDITTADIKVFSHAGITGTISDGSAVTGQSSGATGTVIHATASQILIDAISGTFNNGEEVQVSPGNYVNITDTGNSPIITAHLYNDDGVITELVDIDGLVTSATNYWKITAPLAERHNGTAGTGVVHDPSSTGNAWSINDDNVHVEWIEVKGWTGASAEAFRVNNTGFYLENSILHDANTDTRNDGIHAGASNITFTVNNTIMYNIGSAGILVQNQQNVTVYVNNSTFYKMKNNGVNSDYPGVGTDQGGSRNNSGSVFVIKNTTVHVTSGNAYHFGGGLGVGSSAGSDFNASSDLTAPGTTVLTSVVQADQFVSLTGGSEDFHIKSGANLIDAGTDLGATANVDIDGRDRDAMGDVWDIGADESLFAPPTINIGGTCKQQDEATNCADGRTIRVAVNGTLRAQTTTTSAGAWTIAGVIEPIINDIVTVYIEGVADANEAVAVTKYDGSGNITGVQLMEEHLTIGSDDNQTLTNADLGQYDNSVSGSEDVFHDVNAGALTVDTTSALTDEELYIVTGNGFTPGGTVATKHVQIEGTWTATGSETYTVEGDWEHTNGTFNFATSTVDFTGTGTIKVDIASWWTKKFYNVNAAAAGNTTTIFAGRGVDIDNVLTLGTGNLAGGALIVSKETGTPLITSGATMSHQYTKYTTQTGPVNVTSTTYTKLLINADVGPATFNLAGNINCTDLKVYGNSASITSTLDTTGSNHGITCNTVEVGNATNTKYGTLKLNGSTVDVGGNVTIFASDGGGTNSIDADAATINVAGNWSNSDTFTADTSTVILDGTADQTITSGGSVFSTLTLNNTGGGGSDDIIMADALDVNGVLTITDGDLDIGTNDVAVSTAGNVSIGANGSVDVTARTANWTFDGTTATTYTDATATPQNIGAVVINKTDTVAPATNNKLTLASSMTTNTMTINGTGGQEDTLDLGAGGYTLKLANAGAVADVLTIGGTLTPGTSTVEYAATNSGGNINVVTTPYSSLKVSGSETYVLTGNLTAGNALSGNLTVDTSATLDAVSGSNYNLNAVNIIIAGTYNAQNSTITASGDWDSSSGTFTYGNSTVTLTGGSNNLTTTSSGNAWDQRFYNLSVGSGGDYTVQTAATANGFRVVNLLTLDGKLTVPSGKTVSVAKAGNLVVNGAGELAGAGIFTRPADDGSSHITNSGTISIADFRFSIQGASTAAPVTATTYGGILRVRNNGAGSGVGALGVGTLSVTGNLIIEHSTAGDTVTLDNSVNNTAVTTGGLAVGWNGDSTKYGKLIAGSASYDINGDVNIYASDGSGDNIIDADTATFNVNGNWSNSDAFTYDTSTVVFDGAGQSVSGNTTFYNVNKTVAAADTLTFQDGQATTIATGGTITLNGASGQLLTLASASPGTHWNLNIDSGATKAIDYVSVSWSDASSSHASQKNINPTNSTDGGNNIAWFGYLISGTVYTDEATTLIGDGAVIRLIVNGADNNWTDTTSGGTGQYSITAATLSASDDVIVYIDGFATDGTTMTVSDGGNLSGLDIYGDHVIVRNDNAGTTTSADMDTALGALGDAEILYDVDGSNNLTIEGGGTVFYLPTSHVYTASATVTTPVLKSLGTYNGGAATNDINGALTIAGGSYTATSGLTRIANNFTVSGGTFSHNSGTIVLDANAATMNIGSAILNHVTINQGSNSVTVTGTADINGDLTITAASNINSGTLSVAGNVTTTDGSVGGSATVLFDGGGAQILGASGGNGDLPGVDINKAGGTLTIQDTIEVAGTGNGWTHTAGTVDAGTSTIVFGIGNKFVNATGMSFNDADVNIGGNTLTVTGTMDVNGNLSVTSANNISGGTIAVAGNVTTTDGNVGGSNVVLFDGNGAQLLSASGGTGSLPGVDINKSAGTLTIQDTIVIIGANNGWTHTAGTVDAGTSTVFFGTGGKTANASGMSFNNVAIGVGSNIMTVTGSLDVDGNLVISDVNSIDGGGAITVAGNFTSTDTTVSGGTTITLDGTGAQNIDTTGGGDLPNSTFTINKASGVAILLSNLAVSSAGQDLTITQGTLDLAGYSLTVNDVLTVDANGILQLEGGETFTTTTTTLNAGSTVIYDGGGSYTGLVVGDAYSNLSFNNAAGTWVLDAALDVNGDLVISSGTLDVDSGGDYQINVAGNWNNSGAFNAQNGAVVLDGSGQAINGSTTFYDLLKDVVSSDTLTFTNGTTQTVSGSLTLAGRSGNILNLRSVSPGTQWNLNVSGSSAVTYVDVDDSNASAGNTIYAYYSTDDSGPSNNNNWVFQSLQLVKQVWTEDASTCLASIPADSNCNSSATSTVVPSNSDVTFLIFIRNVMPVSITDLRFQDLIDDTEFTYQTGTMFRSANDGSAPGDTANLSTIMSAASIVQTDAYDGDSLVDEFSGVNTGVSPDDLQVGGGGGVGQNDTLSVPANKTFAVKFKATKN